DRSREALVRHPRGPREHFYADRARLHRHARSFTDAACRRQPHAQSPERRSARVMTKRMSRSIGAVALSVGLSVCLIASWPHAGSAQNADNSVCYTSVGERIKKIADTFAVHAKPAGNTSQWQAWDRRFWARTERLV